MRVSDPEMSRVAKIGLVSVGALLVVLGINAFQPPVPLSKVDSIKEGMTQTEVRAILGEPTKIYASGQWTYKHPLRFGFVNVWWKGDTAWLAHYEEF
jgi:hypothetical protein